MKLSYDRSYATKWFWKGIKLGLPMGSIGMTAILMNDPKAMLIVVICFSSMYFYKIK